MGSSKVQDSSSPFSPSSSGWNGIWDTRALSSRGYPVGNTWLLTFSNSLQERSYRSWLQNRHRKCFSSTSSLSRLVSWAILFAFQVAFVVILFIVLKLPKHKENRQILRLSFMLPTLFALFSLFTRWVNVSGTLWNRMMAPLFSLLTILSGFIITTDECANDKDCTTDECADDKNCTMESLVEDVLVLCLVAIMMAVTQISGMDMTFGEAMFHLTFTGTSLAALFAAVISKSEFPGFFFENSPYSVPVMMLTIWISLAWIRWREEVRMRIEFVRDMIQGEAGEEMWKTSENPTGEAQTAEDANVMTRRTAILRTVNSINNRKVEIMESIGQGTFGYIYRARYHGEIVAVKTFDFKTGNGVLEHFERELEITRMVHHPNVISLFGANQDIGENMASIILEYAPYGTFQDILSNSEVNWENARERILLGICKGMCYLHHFLEVVVIHHDLKPSNIFITDSFDAKIADFGVSLAVPRTHGNRLIAPIDASKDQALRGSPMWLPPEVHKGLPYTEKVDVYAFSLIFCESLIGDGCYVVKSFKATNEPISELMKRNFRPNIPESVRVARPELVQLLERCWDENPDNRPSFREINLELTGILQLEREKREKRISGTCVSETSFDEADDIDTINHNGGNLNGQRDGRGKGPSTDKKEGAIQNEVDNIDDEEIEDEEGSESNLTPLESDLERIKAISKSLQHAPVRSQFRQSVNGTGQGRNRTPKSPSGRAFSTFSTASGSTDRDVLRQLCKELQEELGKQAIEYEEKLEKQKDDYEKKLAQLASAVL